MDPLERIELLTAYPNPATSELRLQYEMENSDDALIEVFGMDGKKLISVSINVLQGQNESVINVSELDNGMYIVKLQSGKKLGGLMFFKQ